MADRSYDEEGWFTHLLAVSQQAAFVNHTNAPRFSDQVQDPDVDSAPALEGLHELLNSLIFALHPSDANVFSYRMRMRGISENHRGWLGAAQYVDLANEVLRDHIDRHRMFFEGRNP